MVIASVVQGSQNVLGLWIAYVFFTLALPVFGIGFAADHLGRSFWRWGLLGGAATFTATTLTVLTLTVWTP